jgi:hypothetical protein
VPPRCSCQQHPCTAQVIHSGGDQKCSEHPNHGPLEISISQRLSAAIILPHVQRWLNISHSWGSAWLVCKHLLCCQSRFAPCISVLFAVIAQKREGRRQYAVSNFLCFKWNCDANSLRPQIRPCTDVCNHFCRQLMLFCRGKTLTNSDSTTRTSTLYRRRSMLTLCTCMNMVVVACMARSLLVRNGTCRDIEDMSALGFMSAW